MEPRKKIYAVPTPQLPATEVGGSRVQHVIDSVVTHIRDARLRAGDELPSEAQFAEELGVGRNVMREAFGALAALSVIDKKNGRKPRVAALSTGAMYRSLHHAIETSQISLQQVWQVRHCLEPKAAALAASQRTTEDAEKILRCAALMAKNEPAYPQLVQYDLQLHEAIAKATHNTLMAQLLCSFMPLMMHVANWGWKAARTPVATYRILKHHQHIAEAIANSDPVAAERAMNEHFDPALTLFFTRTRSYGDPTPS